MSFPLRRASPDKLPSVHVLDNQLVHSNEPLVEIDPADYAMTVAQKQSAADAQQASYQTMLAGWQLMQAKVTTAEADARKAQADADAAESTAKKAQADFARAQDLLKQNTVSQQEFDAMQAANIKAQADFKSAQDNVASAISKVDEAKRTLAAAWAQVGTVEAQWREAQTNVAAAKSICPSRIFLRPPTAASRARPSRPAITWKPASSCMSIVPTKSGSSRTSRNRS
jgi:multidrug resistance efflux pump